VTATQVTLWTKKTISELSISIKTIQANMLMLKGEITHSDKDSQAGWQKNNILL